eukprot:345713_1
MVSVPFILFSILLVECNTIENCVECLLITVGAPEQHGGPTNANYDTNVASIIVNSDNEDTKYEQRCYNAHSISYLIYNNSEFLPMPGIEIGLNPGKSPSDFDYCGDWINAVINNQPNESLNIVHGFYHEEWQCDYAYNFYTNKSIAYAISTDGGLSFIKPNYPNNIIISGANTSTKHTTGEGDHQVAIVNNSILYLYFMENNYENSPYGVSIGLAKSKQYGIPGTWFKYLNGTFSSPGIRGDSSMISNITGTCVRYRSIYNDFISMGQVITNPLVGYGPRLSFSKNGINNWILMNESLLFLDSMNWNRESPVGEFIAYSSLISKDIELGINNLYDFVNNNSYWLYYTWMPPNGTNNKYLVRRSLKIIQYENIIPSNIGQVRVVLSYYYNSNKYDSWFTTALVPINNSYNQIKNVFGMILTKNMNSKKLTNTIYGCYIK